MEREVQSTELLNAIEDALVHHNAFGDDVYILGQLEVAFRRRLERLSGELPLAKELLEVFDHADSYTRYRVAGNTVIRCSAQHAHFQLESKEQYGLPIPECEKVFKATIRHLELGKIGTPFENDSVTLQRLGDKPHYGWIWNEEYPDDVFGRSFRKILKQEYGDSLCTINDDELAMLMKGKELLEDLLPFLANSALGHAHLIACFPDVGFWKGKVSSSQIRMGGTIFLNRQMLMNPWCVAEHLLHESLHQKLYDFRHGHSLLDPDFSSDDPPRVCSLWNAQELNRANYWDTHRAFAAFHVYVQLSLLAMMAEQRVEELETKYGPYRGLIESRKALERARYLGEKLRELCSEELGTAGKRLLNWLMSVLDFLDPAPPPKGAYIHLLLDLYQREANRVDTVLSESEAAGSSFSRELTPVVAAEVESTRRVLWMISAEKRLDEFNTALAQYSSVELGSAFPKVRRIIAKTLLEASADGYGLKSSVPDQADPNELVKQMVEAGSERLYLIQENVPAAVAGAKRRAKDLRFTKSCEDKVGRLLAVFAATVPSGGRILEIGTGVGVSLSWIITGLRERNDVEVISIESEQRLSKAASTWPWPANVKILTADALDVLATVGTFDLVFADAAPIKYGNIGTVLSALRPGGVLVIDDLVSDSKTTDQQQTEKDTLRRSLLRNSQLQALELDWSTGLILATKPATVSIVTPNPATQIDACLDAALSKSAKYGTVPA
jgi:predicted O-methyltransferase YrrM